MRFTGRNDPFYSLLEAQADAAHRAAKEFGALSTDFENLPTHIERIEEIEHEGDDFTHQLANKVDSTFVTPLDKEDLHKLSSALDDITDFIEAATSRLALYEIRTPRPDLPPLVDLLVQITKATAEAIAGLRTRNREALHDMFVRIHQLENDSDVAFRQALARLFNAPGADPLMCIKWKEIYDRIEIAVDKCEDAANVVESVVVKYA